MGIFDFLKREVVPYNEDKAKTNYDYVLFADSIDTASMIGSRRDFMREDYTIEPVYYEATRYMHSMWRHSLDLQKGTRAKSFFETLEAFENELKDIHKYNFMNFNPDFELQNYYEIKDTLLINFLNRSFTDEYRKALELKTAKGRIERIDHWFLLMNYYKNYLTPNALCALDGIQSKWDSEMLPTIKTIN